MNKTKLEALANTTAEELQKEIKDPSHLSIALFMQFSLVMTIFDVRYKRIFRYIPTILRVLANATEVIIDETIKEIAANEKRKES